MRDWGSRLVIWTIGAVALAPRRLLAGPGKRARKTNCPSDKIRPQIRPPGNPTTLTGLNGHPLQVIAVPEPLIVNLAGLDRAAMLVLRRHQCRHLPTHLQGLFE